MDRNAQVGDIARGTQVRFVEDSTAHQDAFALSHSRDFPRRRPPVPLRTSPALSSAGDCQRRVAFSSQRSDIVDLEDGPILERGPDEGMFEIER